MGVDPGVRLRTTSEDGLHWVRWSPPTKGNDHEWAVDATAPAISPVDPAVKSFLRDIFLFNLGPPCKLLFLFGLSNKNASSTNCRQLKNNYMQYIRTSFPAEALQQERVQFTLRRTVYLSYSILAAILLRHSFLSSKKTPDST
jgi:hypothetical protein